MQSAPLPSSRVPRRISVGAATCHEAFWDLIPLGRSRPHVRQVEETQIKALDSMSLLLTSVSQYDHDDMFHHLLYNRRIRTRAHDVLASTCSPGRNNA